jgi:hypothetical protein
VAYELRLRWRAQREGRERLSGACYAIPTWLESNLDGTLEKGRGPALGEAGAEHNRQAHGAEKSRARTGVREAEGAAGPLTEAEAKWLEAVTPRLIRRAAEYEAKGPPSHISLWPIYHRYPTNGHHRCLPQDGSDQGQRRWLLIEGLFAAVQLIRKPVAALHDPRLGSFCSPNRTRA